MNVMTVEIDFSLPFNGCYNGCLAFNDFCSFWLFEHTVEMAACDQVCGGVLHVYDGDGNGGSSSGNSGRVLGIISA
jgi:hypothetical protein